MFTFGEAGRLQRAKRPIGIGTIGGVALLMGAIELQHVLAMSTVRGVVGFAVIPFLFNLGLLAGGYVLWRRRFRGDEVLRITAWVLFGIVLLAFLAAWTITHQNVRGRPFTHAPFVVVNNMSVGGLIGFTLGWYDVRGRRQQRAVETERAKLEFLNHLLRHNVLNGMQIVTGYGTLLEDHVDEAGQQQLATVVARSKEVIRLIQGVKELMANSLDQGSELRPYDLADVLTHQVQASDRSQDLASVSADLPEDAFVLADELLPDLFDNLITNAVKHNDSDSPEVTVSASVTDDSVIVRIADNGPGIPEEKRRAVLDWNVKGESSTGTGVGLAIVDTLVERYGGSLWIEDNDPRGTVVTVSLPRMQSSVERPG